MRKMCVLFFACIFVCFILIIKKENVQFVLKNKRFITFCSTINLINKEELKFDNIIFIKNKLLLMNRSSAFIKTDFSFK